MQSKQIYANAHNVHITEFGLSVQDFSGVLFLNKFWESHTVVELLSSEHLQACQHF